MNSAVAYYNVTSDPDGYGIESMPARKAHEPR
jgi:hypothetical protein